MNFYKLTFTDELARQFVQPLITTLHTAKLLYPFEGRHRFH